MLHSRDLIVDNTRLWLGTRWVHQGRSSAGIDCVGLIIRVAQSIGIEPEDFHGYSRRPNGSQFLKHLREQADRGDINDPKPGSIAVFKQNQFPCHTAVFALKYNKLSIIHAHASRKKVVEDMFDFEWPSKLMDVLEFPGVID